MLQTLELESRLQTTALLEPLWSLWTASLKDNFSFEIKAGLQDVTVLPEHTRRQAGIFKQDIQDFHDFYESSGVFTISCRKSDMNSLSRGI